MKLDAHSNARRNWVVAAARRRETKGAHGVAGLRRERLGTFEHRGFGHAAVLIDDELE